MELLHDLEHFQAWKGNKVSVGDNVCTPRRFPCFAHREVLDWRRRRIVVEYLYCEDLKQMLEAMAASTRGLRRGP